MGKLAVIAYGIACAAEFAALGRARWSDVSWDPGAPERSVVHVRGTKNEHRDRFVPHARASALARLRASPRPRDRRAPLPSLTIRQLKDAHERSQPGATLNPNPKVKAVARRSGQG